MTAEQKFVPTKAPENFPEAANRFDNPDYIDAFIGNFETGEREKRTRIEKILDEARIVAQTVKIETPAERYRRGGY